MDCILAPLLLADSGAAIGVVVSVAAIVAVEALSRPCPCLVVVLLITWPSQDRFLGLTIDLDSRLGCVGEESLE
jgi:hypothetical protein